MLFDFPRFCTTTHDCYNMALSFIQRLDIFDKLFLPIGKNQRFQFHIFALSILGIVYTSTDTLESPSVPLASDLIASARIAAFPKIPCLAVLY